MEAFWAFAIVLALITLWQILNCLHKVIANQRAIALLMGTYFQCSGLQLRVPTDEELTMIGGRVDQIIKGS